MRIVMGMVGLIALTLVGCTKAEAQDQPATHEHHECKCETKVSEPIWRFGTLCQKGELSQGHGLNKNGQVVSGCVTLKHEGCVCEPHDQH